MCYTYKVKKPKKEIETRFDAEFEIPFDDLEQPLLGFEHPLAPIILDTKPKIITLGRWGLVPTWSKELNFKPNTLNANIDTITQKPSYKDSINNRCLIPATSYFESQWLDEKGKQKRKYEIHSSENEIFSFAGIYNIWKSPEGIHHLTYTILTTQADQMMAKIHNTKKRMPIMLNQKDEIQYLQGANLQTFAFPYTTNKIAF